jgi:predicted ATPase
MLGDHEAAVRFAEECLQVASEHGFMLFVVGGMGHLGIAKSALGDVREGLAMVEQCVAGWRASGANLGLGFFLHGLARARRAAGDAAGARAAVDEALVLAEQTDERYFTAELLRLRGELTVEDDPAVAAADFERAADVARQQGAKLFELRATLALYRLHAAQGRAQETRDRLAEVCAWFPEGSTEADLRAARELLGALPAA